MKSFFRHHCHWIIAALVLIQLAVFGGISNNLSLFTIPVSESLGISRGTFSLAGSLKAITGFLSSILSGVLLLRFGYRKSVLASMAIAIAGYGILSASDSIVLYSLGYAILGMADGVCVSAGPTRIISAWFHRHQGTIFGAVTAATGLGGSLMCLVLTGVIQSAGWNSAFLCCAVFVAVLALLMLILMRNKPEDIGLRPYGEGEKVFKKNVGSSHWIGYTFQELLRAPAFYMMILGTFVSCVFSLGALNIMVPHLQDRGLSAQEAAAMQSTLMLLLAAMKLGCGVLTDAIGAKRVMLICLVCTAVSLLLFAFVTGPAAALIAVLIFSVSLPLAQVMIPLLSTELFGYQAQPNCVGIFMSMNSLASVVALPVANMIYDRMGSYSPLFLAAAAGTVLLIGMYLVMYKLTARDKQRIQATHNRQV